VHAFRTIGCLHLLGQAQKEVQHRWHFQPVLFQHSFVGQHRFRFSLLYYLTLVQSTHNTGYALEWADRVIILHEGKIVQQGKPETVLADKAMLEQYGLEMPAVLNLFLSLPEQMQTANRPKSMHELKAILAQ
jgi:hypothetical protein